ncbi:MAG TPA: efflux RND transporter periplasmic adaptor subunit [Candidatus Ventrimonas merdavium]|mgnify:FL=1|nr:efflux RND transporter periplasmic adaptor subunit [Candidatus Ventrimonas merdavium]
MDRKRMIAAAAVVVLAAAAGTALYMRSGKETAGGPGGMAGGAMPGGGMESSAAVVRAAVPDRGDLSVTSSLTGTVEAGDVVYVYAKAAGDVTAVHVKAGDTVQAGQVLCEIDTEQVETAKNSLDSAQISLAEAQSSWNRIQLLYSGGDVSQQEYEQSSNALRSAQIQYDSAKLAYDRQVEYSTITAPISGTVESCDVDVYDRVNQSQQLCVIGGSGEKRITFYVSQRMLDQMQVGDALEVVKNGTTYDGTVSEISTMVDEGSGLFKVKAEMEDTDQIAIGSTVKLNVVTERAEDAMLVPVNAIYYSGGDAYVYLYEDGKASMVPVEVGIYDSDYAQILSGLSESDMVIGTWSSNLYEGATVRLYEEVQGGSGAAPDAAPEAGGPSDQEAPQPADQAGQDASQAAQTPAPADDQA